MRCLGGLWGGLHTGLLAGKAAIGQAFANPEDLIGEGGASVARGGRSLGLDLAGLQVQHRAAGVGVHRQPALEVPALLSLQIPCQSTCHSFDGRRDQRACNMQTALLLCCCSGGCTLRQPCAWHPAHLKSARDLGCRGGPPAERAPLAGGSAPA